MEKKVAVVFVIGVPAAGKSTLCQRIYSSLQKNTVKATSADSEFVLSNISVSYISFDELYPPRVYISVSNHCVDRQAYKACQKSFLDTFSLLLCSRTIGDRSGILHAILVEDIMDNLSKRKAYIDRIAEISSKSSHHQAGPINVETVLFLHMLPSPLIRGPHADLEVILRRNHQRPPKIRIPEEKMMKIFHTWRLPESQWERKIWLSARPRCDSAFSVPVKVGQNTARRRCSLGDMLIDAIKNDYVIRRYRKNERFHQLHM